ncbi:MAG: hypothetical protein NT058_01545 [Candidatus Portnoybacteria bacterium]|nr:hypothetical protein [Candidatus Portnoybacteria bacterium]
MNKFEEALKRTTVSGKDITSEEKEAIKKDVGELLINRREGSRIFEGETEKTLEQIEIINIAIKLVNEELKKLKIDEKFEFPIEKIHFLPTNVFEERSEETDGRKRTTKERGITDQEKHEIMVDGSMKKPELLWTLIHELTHMASYEKYCAYVNNKPNDNAEEELLEITIKNRIGYQLPEKNGKSYLQGLNEMITEKVSIDIYKKHKHEIKKEINLSRKEIKKIVDSKRSDNYPFETLDLIIEEIARVKKEKVDDVWKRFEKGLFSGEMMHLRDIERVFGDGALRVLSVLNLVDGYNKNGDITKKRNEDKIFRYFITSDKLKRKKIAEEIFSSVEFEKYKKQTKER